MSFVRGRIGLKWTISYLGDIPTGAVAASATVPPNTFNYQAKRTRIGVNAQYSITPRYSASSMPSTGTAASPPATLARILVSMSAAIGSFWRKKSFAASRPCPSRVSPKAPR